MLHFARIRAKKETEYGPRTCLKVVRERQGKPPLVAYFGGISLRRKKTAILHDQPTQKLFSNHHTVELVTRLLADECEICKSTEKVEVHHIRKLADLKKGERKELPLWKKKMIAFQRKTLVLCQCCHKALHAGKPLPKKHDAE